MTGDTSAISDELLRCVMELTKDAEARQPIRMKAQREVNSLVARTRQPGGVFLTPAQRALERDGAKLEVAFSWLDDLFAPHDWSEPVYQMLFARGVWTRDGLPGVETTDDELSLNNDTITNQQD